MNVFPRHYKVCFFASHRTKIFIADFSSWLSLAILIWICEYFWPIGVVLMFKGCCYAFIFIYNYLVCPLLVFFIFQSAITPWNAAFASILAWRVNYFFDSCLWFPHIDPSDINHSRSHGFNPTTGLHRVILLQILATIDVHRTLILVTLLIVVFINTKASLDRWRSGLLNIRTFSLLCKFRMDRLKPSR